MLLGVKMVKRIVKNFRGQTVFNTDITYKTTKTAYYELLKLIQAKFAHNCIEKSNGIFYAIYKNKLNKKTNRYNVGYMDSFYNNSSDAIKAFKGHRVDISKYKHMGYDLDNIEHLFTICEIDKNLPYIIRRKKIDENGLFILIRYLAMNEKTTIYSIMASMTFGKAVKNKSIILMLEKEMPKGNFFHQYLKTNAYELDPRIDNVMRFKHWSRSDVMEELEMVEALEGKDGVERWLGGYEIERGLK